MGPRGFREKDDGVFGCVMMNDYQAGLFRVIRSDRGDVYPVCKLTSTLYDPPLSPCTFVSGQVFWVTLGSSRHRTTAHRRATALGLIEDEIVCSDLRSSDVDRASGDDMLRKKFAL